MTQEDILEMAQEAGYQHPNAVGSSEAFEYFDLEHFASLVATAEREACAKVCDELANPSRSHSDPSRAWVTGTLDCAAAIRARGGL